MLFCSKDENTALPFLFISMFAPLLYRWFGGCACLTAYLGSSIQCPMYFTLTSDRSPAVVRDASSWSIRSNPYASQIWLYEARRTVSLEQVALALIISFTIFLHFCLISLYRVIVVLSSIIVNRYCRCSSIIFYVKVRLAPL